MFVSSSTTTRIRSLISRIPSSAEGALKINQGAAYIVASRGMSTGDLGSGAGKGGGSGGSVREAGGAIGKKGAAQEELYFSRQNRDTVGKMKEHLKDEIKKHEEAIKAKKELMKEIDK